MQSLNEMVHNEPIYLRTVHIRKETCAPGIDQVKSDLCKWGETAQLLAVLRNEIKRMEQSINGLKERGTSIPQEESLSQTIQNRVDLLMEEAEERVQFATKIDAIILKLDREEEMFLRLRFQKRVKIEEIQRRMYLSRASVFRLQNRCFKHILEIAEAEGREE